MQKPLFWYQGAYFQPQHLQQLELSWESRLVPYHQWLTPHFWGVQELQIKASALGVRSFGILHGRFLFQDGTAVEFPGNAVIDDRSFVDAWLDGGKPLRVYVGLKKWNNDSENVTVVKSGDTSTEVATRYLAGADPEETRDLHAGGPAGHVKKLTHLLKIFWEPEKDFLGDYLLIPIAQLERRGPDVILDPHFIPPCLTYTGSETLVGLLKDIRDQLSARSRQLEEHKRQRGIQSAEFGSRDMVYVLALRSINRCLPVLQHYAETSQLHPWHVYGLLRQIVGDLSCFSESFNALGEGLDAGEVLLSEYDPRNLWTCFATARARISRLLSEITSGPDYLTPLSLHEGLYSATLKPEMFDSDHRFYLALTLHHEGKKTVDAVQSLAKLSSGSQIQQLIAYALPGIELEHLPQVPQELPRREDVLYFRINTADEQWSHVKKTHEIAFAWDGAPEGLRVDVMGVGV